MRFDTYLHFPQWQGGPNQAGITLGSGLLFKALHDAHPFQSFPLDQSTGSQPEADIWHYSAIKNNIHSAKVLLNQLQPKTLFTLGGDCSIDVASIDYLHQRYGSKLGVLYLDAHADLHAPWTSRSKNFHGMPVRTLFGESDNGILAELSSPLTSKQLCYAGLRCIETAETECVQARSIPNITSVDINADDYTSFVNWYKQSNIEYLHIHFDIDIIDPAEGISVTYPEPDGVRMDALQAFFTFLQTKTIVGVTVTEFAPEVESSEEVKKVLSSFLTFLAD